MIITRSESLITILLMFFPLTVVAQETPKLEIFGGYSYLRLTRQTNAGLESANLNGWNASVKWNLTPRIGLVADFSGNYGQRGRTPLSLSTTSGQITQIGFKPGDMRQHTFLFGPEFRLVRSNRLTLNVRTLVGVAQTNTLVLPLNRPIERPPDIFGNPQPSITQFTVGSRNAFAASFGASLDYRITDRLSYRIVQPEILLTRYGVAAGDEYSTHADVRVSTGILFRFGKSVSSNPSGPHFSFGAIGGASLTDAFGHESSGFIVGPNGERQPTLSRYYSTSKDYIVGPKVEFGFPGRLSVEVDALYRPLHLTMAGVQADGSLNSVSPATVVTWEFPVLAKYKFQARNVWPFIELGPSFRTAGNVNGASPSAYGGTAGLGIEDHVGKVKIAPVVRYTHWAADNEFIGPRSKRNQAELLVGLSF